MRRLLLILLLVLCGGAFLYQALQKDSGYVLVSYAGSSIEMSLWIAISAILTGAFLLWLSVSLWRSLYRGFFGGWSAWLDKRARHSRDKTTRGLLAYIEGHWSQARRLLEKSALKSETPLINYLIAAHAANEMGDERRAQQNLSKAEKISDDEPLAIVITQARLHLNAQRYEKALAAILRCKEQAPDHPVVLSLLKQVYTKLAAWEDLIDLLPELKQQLDNKAYAEVLAFAHCENIKHLSQRHANLEQANAVWLRVPKNLRNELLSSFIDALQKLGHEAFAEELLRATLKKYWQPEWVTLYGRIQGEDTERQLLQGEQWLKQRPSDNALLVSLGRLSLRNERWEKAREYFEAAIDLGAGAEAHAELGRLLANQQQYEKSSFHFQQSVQAIAGGLPKLPMPKGMGK